MEDGGFVQIGQEANGIKILQLTDLHHMPSDLKVFHSGERVVNLEENGYRVQSAIELISQLLDSERPDFVILTGDILDGRAFSDKSPKDWRHAMMEVLQPILAREIAWTFVPGNHDDDHTPWPRSALLGILSLPFCVSRNVSSFSHTLSVGPTPETAVRLFLFDSGGPNKKTRYDGVSEGDVIQFKHTTQKLKTDPSTIHQSGLAFLHIPLPEYHGAMAVAGHMGLYVAETVKRATWTMFPHLPVLARLLALDAICRCPRVNSGLFEALSASRLVCSVFCGHDHFNDAVLYRQPLFLCYGRVGSFTPPSNWEGKGGSLPFNQGARVIIAIPTNDPSGSLSPGQNATIRTYTVSHRGSDGVVRDAACVTLRPSPALTALAWLRVRYVLGDVLALSRWHVGAVMGLILTVLKLQLAAVASN